MVTNRFHPAPGPSTPERAPWEDAAQVLSRLDRLIQLMEAQQGLVSVVPGELGLPGAPGFPGLPGAPGAVGDIHLLVKLTQELVPGLSGASQIIPFQKTIATAYQDEQTRNIPFTGILRHVIMAFPAGCQQLVEVRMVYLPKAGSTIKVVPSLDDTFIALDDFTVVFEPMMIVVGPGQLLVEWYNYDSRNTHSVPVIATLVPTLLPGGG